jgi:hypothetical protein
VTEPTHTEPEAVEPTPAGHPATEAVGEAPTEVPAAAFTEAFTEPPAAVPAPRVPKDRRVLRAILRWTAATVAFAAFGAGAAYAVTVPHRTDLPGLATPGDGRWDFPGLKPVGKGQTVPGGHHMTDLRELLLPRPQGAKADESLPGTDGWYAASAFTKLFTADSVGDENARLKQAGLRHVAATGWTMPDGMHTRIFLLQFDRAAYAAKYAQDASNDTLATAEDADPDVHIPGVADGLPKDITLLTFNEEEPSGATHDRYAWLSAGDAVALVIESHPHRAADVPFRQTVVLQAQLLG